MSVINTNGMGGGNWTDPATWQGGVVPVFPNTGAIIGSDVVDEVPHGQVCSIMGDGRIWVNHGTVTMNYNGVVAENAIDGVVDENQAVIENNYGLVTFNNNGNVVYNYGTVVTSSGGVQFLMNMTAVAGPTTIHSDAFSDPGVGSVIGGKEYRFNSETKTGVFVSGGEVKTEAGVVMAYNDNPNRMQQGSGGG